MGELLTTRQVAAWLAVDVKKVLRLIHEDTLDAINIDPKGQRPTYRVSPEALAEFVRRHQLTPEPNRRRHARQRAMRVYEFIK
jgi:excisionase family DNA binding protein